MKNRKFQKHDADGFGMAIIAMSVVFIGLILLYVSFKIVGNIAVKLGKRNAMKAIGITDKVEAKEKNLGITPANSRRYCNGSARVYERCTRC